MKLPESVENYLETILLLSHGGELVRSVDIANRMGYSKPSVSIAMKNLRASEYITVDGNGHITLTDSGRQVAQGVYDRHALISGWLISLGVDAETAVRDACGMEHSISEASFRAIRKHIEQWKQAPGK